MPRAICLIREMPHYRREAFGAGLAAAGYKVEFQDYHRATLRDVKREDVLVIWNRYSVVEQLADRFEAQGARVLCAENGYLGSDELGRQHYALALHKHNGAGQWSCGGPERWAGLGIEIKPWRKEGEHILVCPNRSFGPKGFAMPQSWAADVVSRLRTHTKRPIRLRPHPGNWQKEPPKVPLAEDLKGAWAVVIWASSAGLHALLAGIPVFREAPFWIAASASERDIARIESPAYPERQDAFERLAWAQFSVAELASGEPFRRLLS